MGFRKVTLEFLATVFAGAFAFVGSSCKEPADPPAAEEVSAPASSANLPEFRRTKPNIPVGPSLAIEAGQGVGAIRFGARVDTIERLMQHPCEVLSENLCRYVIRGVDFHLVNGELYKVHVQRAERPAGRDAAGKPVTFGFFNGGIRPDLVMGMTPAAMQEYLGKPERIERVPEPNPQNMVARDYYPGLIIEYDRYKNGNIIFAGAIVFKDPRVDAELALEAAKPKPPPAPPPPPRFTKPEVIH
jgi:hypothetical protein